MPGSFLNYNFSILAELEANLLSGIKILSRTLVSAPVIILPKSLISCIMASRPDYLLPTSSHNRSTSEIKDHISLSLSREIFCVLTQITPEPVNQPSSYSPYLVEPFYFVKQNNTHRCLDGV
jgi:hypothetical protein